MRLTDLSELAAAFLGTLLSHVSARVTSLPVGYSRLSPFPVRSRRRRGDVRSRDEKGTVRVRNGETRAVRFTRLTSHSLYVSFAPRVSSHPFLTSGPLRRPLAARRDGNGMRDMRHE